MNYEKAYKDALERAKIFKGHLLEIDEKDYADEIEYIFPELVESKDERIRNVIRGWIYTRPTSFFDNGISKEEILAWLEKQGEKPKWSEEDSLMIDSIIDTMKWLEGKGATNMKIDWLKSLKQRMGV